MTYGEQQVFTFDLNESLWFKKGQEVDEIMGISLEPEISIQEYDEFVSVRGVIELKGEYFQVRDGEEDQVLSLRDHPSQRFVDRVESYEDGVNEFFHNFPVEVSIPKYRIDSIDDVRVGIEFFDYEIPENSQLKLNATIAIHGVNDEQAQVETNPDPESVIEPEVREEENNFVEDDPIPVPPQPPVEDTFEFDVKEQVESESAEEEPEPLGVPRDTEDEVEDEVVEEEEESPQVKEASKNRKSKKSQSFAEFFGQLDANKEQEEESISEVESSISSSESDMVSIAYNEDVSPDEMESSREAPSDQDPTYLLNLFGGEEEEKITSMKICIVQDSDTLDSIAEKYNVSPLHISNTNRLDDDELIEGQIIYIPSKVTKID